MRGGDLGVWSEDVFFALAGATDAMNDILARLKADPLAALRGVLLDAPPDEIGHDDYDLHPELRPPAQTAAVEAAVLLPIDHARPSPRILFTQPHRSIWPRHSGQVSFPGGRRDAGDLSPVETALRETMEETGIEPAFVSVAGYLPRYRTGTGFDISPVVGVLSEGFTLAPDPRRSGGNLRSAAGLFSRSRQPAPGNAANWGGRERSFYAFSPEGRITSGARRRRSWWISSPA